MSRATRARKSRNRRLAREQRGPAQRPTMPMDLYGKKGYIEGGDGERFEFDMGEILWALGTGQITGGPAKVAAAAWIHVIQDGRDPLTIIRDAAGIGLDPGQAFEALSGGMPEPDELPSIARSLIDAGLLPPPPGA